MSDMKAILGAVASGKPLPYDVAREAFRIIMRGDATPGQIGAFLMGLRVRGETVEELTAGAEAMREHVLPVRAPDGAIDTCGTGGDGSGTYNISTATSIVVAAAGVPVAKHGNRALSSKTGAADVLEHLGISMDADVSAIEGCFEALGIGFLPAFKHHAAMRHVGPVRADLATRTIFNLLGPLSNPAGTKRQLMGVFAREWVEPLAHVHRNLGAEHVWVVHGSDGLDEITTTGPTLVAELKDGEIRTFEVTPADAGLPLANSADLKGGSAAENATALRGILAGDKNAYRDIVILNTAAALIIGGKVRNLMDGAHLAASVIDSGAADATLTAWIARSGATTDV